MSNLLHDPGEIAYSAFCNSRKGKSNDGKKLPQFSELPPDAQASWRAVFAAIKEALEAGA